MKKIILSLVLISQCVFGQTEKSYVISYIYMNVGLDELTNVDLYTKGSQSLTVFHKNNTVARKNDFNDEGNFNVNIEGNDKIGKRVYKDLKDKKIIFRDFYSVNGKLKPCIVEEDLPNFKWNFGIKDKKIGKYLCQSAELDFRGRAYNVWYTTQIPINQGPWKFYGLPGLIMEVKSKDSNIHFLIDKVKEINNLSSEIEIPQEGDKISLNDYIKHKENAINDFINKLYATLPRGAKITINSSSKNYNLEKEFPMTKSRQGKN